MAYSRGLIPILNLTNNQTVLFRGTFFSHVIIFDDWLCVQCNESVRFCFSPGLYFEVGDAAYDSQTVRAGRRNRRHFPGHGFMNQLVSCSPSQSAMMAYMPMPSALGIISDYQASNPENQKVQGSSLNGWPLPALLLGNKTAVGGLSEHWMPVFRLLPSYRADIWCGSGVRCLNEE